MIQALVLSQSKYSQKAYYFDSLDFQTFNSEPRSVRFLPSKSQSKTQHLLTSIQLKIMVFLSCTSILIVRNLQNKQFKFIFFRYSNSYFTRTTILVSSVWIGVEKNLDVQGFRSADCRFVFLASGFRQSEVSKKCYFFHFVPYSNWYSTVTTNSKSSISLN